MPFALTRASTACRLADIKFKRLAFKMVVCEDTHAPRQGDAQHNRPQPIGAHQVNPSTTRDQTLKSHNSQSLWIDPVNYLSHR